MGTEPGHLSACLWTLVVSPALQGLWPLLLVPSTPFGADCSVGSCLIFSDWPKRLSLEFPVSALYHFAFPVPSRVCQCESGQPSLVADGGYPCSLPPAWPVRATHSLPGVSRGLFSEVVRGDHPDPEASHRCFSDQRALSTLSFLEIHSDVSR